MNNITSMRITEKNKIDLLIKQSLNIIKRNEETIIRLKNQSKTDFNIDQIKKLKQGINEKKMFIDTMNERIQLLNKGNLDTELQEAMLETQKEIERKNNEKKSRENINTESNAARHNKSKQIYDDDIKQYKKERYQQKDFDNTYKYFCKVIDTIPSYMLEKLDDMPNNKGYIWRDVYFYGTLPAEKGPVVMFEKKNNSLYIHEWDKKYYSIYEKQGKSSYKKLISKNEREMKQK